jgi:hypothetical protein
MANIFRREDLALSPYRRTAFKALGLTANQVDRASIVHAAEARRQAVTHVPGYHQLGGRPLTLADINRAEEALLDPNRRVIEELLEHAPEQPVVDQLQVMASRLEAPDWPVPFRAPRQPGILALVAQELVRNQLLALPSPDLPPFPIDTSPIPPFPRAEPAEDG